MNHLLSVKENFEIKIFLNIIRHILLRRTKKKNMSHKMGQKEYNLLLNDLLWYKYTNTNNWFQLQSSVSRGQKLVQLILLLFLT